MCCSRYVGLGPCGGKCLGTCLQTKGGESTLVQTGLRTPWRLVEKEDLSFGDVSLTEYVMDECDDGLGYCVLLLDYPVE